MAEFPVLPLFTDALMSDTDHLTTLEFGAYLKLLITAWRSRGCCLPDDDVKLARYARLTRSQWLRIKPTIEEFFTVQDGLWNQRRLTDEYNHVRQVRESQIRAGKISALKRKARHSTGAQRPLNERATPSPSPLEGTLPLEENGNGASAPLDPEKVMFDSGIALLMAAGKSEAQARSVIGRWKRDYETESIMVMMGRAQRQGAIDPVSFIEGALRSKRQAYDPDRITV